MDALDDLTPPSELWFFGVGDFKAGGQEGLRQLVEVGGLRPDDRVLDVGCGVGRIAVPLTRHLGSAGGYEGFDVVGPGVEWCRGHITPRFPNFRFQTADLYSSDYNPHGRYDASDFIFPYPDASFDFVFLNSVFTHMLPSGVENYLYEISRVLKPGGRCFATFFLWNAEAAALVRAGKGIYSFRHGRGACRVEVPRRPEAVVCYDEAHVQTLLARYGFEVNGQIHHGFWCGREKCLSGQDVIVATRARPGLAKKPRPSPLGRLARTLRRSVSVMLTGVRYVALGEAPHRGWRAHAEDRGREFRPGGPPAPPPWPGLAPKSVRRLARFLLKRQAGSVLRQDGNVTPGP